MTFRQVQKLSSLSPRLSASEYSQRLSHRARNLLSPQDGRSTGRALFDQAVEGGARAPAREAGALTVGQLADIVVLDQDHPKACVSADRWLDAYLFTSAANAVTDVFVGGRTVMHEGKHLHREGIEKAYKRTLARVAGSI